MMSVPAADDASRTSGAVPSEGEGFAAATDLVRASSYIGEGGRVLVEEGVEQA